MEHLLVGLMPQWNMWLLLFAWPRRSRRMETLVLFFAADMCLRMGGGIQAWGWWAKSF